MKASKFLLGSIEIAGAKDSKQSQGLDGAGDGNDSDDDIDGSIKQYHLASPSQIVIVSYSGDKPTNLLKSSRLMTITATDCLETP